MLELERKRNENMAKDYQNLQQKLVNSKFDNYVKNGEYLEKVLLSMQDVFEEKINILKE